MLMKFIPKTKTVALKEKNEKRMKSIPKTETAALKEKIENDKKTQLNQTDQKVA